MPRRRVVGPETGPPAEAVPLGVLDDTAVIDARDRLLFLDLADGSLVGTVPLDPREDRPVLVPTGVLVRSAAGFQLYDRTGRARWPAPVEAQQALAHAGGVTVLTSCWGGSCGLAGYDSTGWFGVVAPAGTPPDIIQKLNAAFRESLAPAETRARLDALGAEIKIGTPAEFEKLLADELAKWTAVVKAANIKVE